MSRLREQYYTEEEVAELLQLKRSTMAKNRSLGKNHPPFIKIGARILYPRKEFERWMKGHEIHEEIAG